LSSILAPGNVSVNDTMESRGDALGCWGRPMVIRYLFARVAA
jgi:hypothetical protein